jgi:hypothetical protein
MTAGERSGTQVNETKSETGRSRGCLRRAMVEVCCSTYLSSNFNAALEEACEAVRAHQEDQPTAPRSVTAPWSADTVNGVACVAASSAPAMRVCGATGIETETGLAFAALHQALVPFLAGIDELGGPAAPGVAGGARAGAGPCCGPVPGRAGDAHVAGAGCRVTAGDVPDRRRSVAGCGLGTGAGVRGAAAVRRPGRLGARLRTVGVGIRISRVGRGPAQVTERDPI